MNLSKNRIVTIAIAIFLMFSMSASMMLIPSASAHTPAWNIPTFAYIEVNPNPIGVNQQVTVYMWLDKTYDPASALSNDYRFQNYELTITAPGGAKTTQTFAYISDPTSSQYTHYTPTASRHILFQLYFPGTKNNYQQ